MLGVSAQVLTTYKAHVDDHVRKLGTLERAEKDRARTTVDANKQSSASYEDGLKTIAKYAAGVLSIGAAYGVAKASWQTFAEHQRLTSAAMGVDVEKLRKASGGLRSDMELLRDAARFNAGAFKLTSEQMVVAERAMRSFAAKGLETAKVNDAVTQAVTALKVDGLKDLGVFVDVAGLSMEKAADRAQIFERVMGTLREQTRGVNDDQQTTAERMAATGVSFTNAMDKIKLALGELVVKLEPVVSKVASLIAMLPGLASEGGQRGAQGARGAQDLLRGLPGPLGTDAAMPLDYLFGRGDYSSGNVDTATFFINDAKRRQQAARLYGGGHSGAAGDLLAGNGLAAGIWDGDLSLVPEYLRQRLAAIGPQNVGNPWAADKKSASGTAPKLTVRDLLGAFRDIGGQDSSLLLGMGQRSDLSLGALAGNGNSVMGADFTKALGDFSTNARSATQQWIDEYGRRGAQRTSMLEETIGPLGQFDAYKQAWSGLQGAITAGYEAMVDGSMSFGAAFKLAIGQALKATGAQMLIESLKEAAAGVASLALGPIGGASAAAHFKASALYAAGAVAAGAAASGLGTGGGGGGARGASAAAPAGGGGAAPYQGIQQVVVVGDSFGGDDTSRRAKRNVRNRLQAAGVDQMGLRAL